MRILCFGDSNTWGYEALTGNRFEKRWPVVLQSLLPDDIIIEEGLNGRTFNSYTCDEDKYKVGLDYFLPCIKSHKPLDIVIIGLGANDSKLKYNKSAKDVYKDMLQFVAILQKELPEAKLLFVSSIRVSDDIALRDDFKGANEKINGFVNMLIESDFHAIDMRGLLKIVRQQWALTLG